MNSGPIGIFDSGFGGLTVVAQFLQKLPQESIVFFGDNARVPYGSRSKEEIQAFALEAAEFLVRFGVKALVIACNTATAAALSVIKERFTLPVIGIIESGAKQAVQESRAGEIAILATEYTINSQSYQDIIKSLNPAAHVYGQACPLFVSFVEKGKLAGAEVKAVAVEYLSFLTKTRVDTIVLGCTHYPHLEGVLGSVIGPKVRIIDPAEAVAIKTKETLREKELRAPLGNIPRHCFFTSGDPEQFRRLGQQLLGYPMGCVQKALLGGSGK